MLFAQHVRAVLAPILVGANISRDQTGGGTLRRVPMGTIIVSGSAYERGLQQGQALGGDDC